ERLRSLCLQLRPGAPGRRLADQLALLIDGMYTNAAPPRPPAPPKRGRALARKLIQTYRCPREHGCTAPRDPPTACGRSRARPARGRPQPGRRGFALPTRDRRAPPLVCEAFVETEHIADGRIAAHIRPAEDMLAARQPGDLRSRLTSKDSHRPGVT